jgi:hypothetical protein
MKTRRRILLVLGALLLAFGGLVTVAVVVLGDVAGSIVVVTAVVAAIAGYLTLIRPWQLRRTAPYGPLFASLAAATRGEGNRGE